MIRFLQTQGPTKKIILSGILLVICGAMVLTFIPGGLTSELTGTPGKGIVAKVDGRFVSVRVRDTGPGIPKAELKQVFKRFYRVPGPLASRVKGTGLGLYMVRSVAKHHGGRAWAESEGPGQGSTFVMQLPIRP